jgi:threonyl-tRNA synthetase
MRNILNHIGIEFTEADGEAAFYGPKLDIQIRNVYGKEDTLITVQIDFQLAKKFGMEYVDADGSKKYPYVIHRTSIGCYERTLALLLEKYAERFRCGSHPFRRGFFPYPTDSRLMPRRFWRNCVKRGLGAK